MTRPALSIHAPVALHVAIGDTLPNGVYPGAQVWSTLEQQVLVWNGSSWQPIAPPQAQSDRTYVHTQGVASETWVVPHNLGKFPSVTVVDSSGQEVRGDVTHDSPNQCTLTFAFAFSGKAFCN